MSNEQVLVEAFRAGDRDAFAILIERYQNYVAAIAYSSTGDFSRSEDITQQAFLTAWKRQRELKDCSKWRSWLRGITKNLLRNDYRKRTRESALLDHGRDSLELADHSLPEQACINEERSQLLWSILEQIPENYREPLVLYYREGKSVSAVAEMLELSEDVVKQRLARGRKLVKTEIAQFVEDLLLETRPTPRLSAAVIASLPSAGSALAGKASGSLLGSLIPVKFLMFAIGPLVGIAGAVFGSKKSLDSATSQQERRYMWKLIFICSAVVIAMVTLQLVVAFAFPQLMANAAWQIAMWTGYAIFLVVFCVVGNANVRRIKREYGTEREKHNIANNTVEPVSVRGMRWNLIGMIGGTCTVLFVATILTQDWVFLGLTILLVSSLMVYTWALAPTRIKVSDQLRFNAQISLMTCLLVAVMFLFRWDHWSAALKMKDFASSWIIAAAVLVFGVLLFALLHWQAAKINSQNPDR